MKEMKIAIILDIDGVLNQYRKSERIRRHKKLEYLQIFAPYPKKVNRLNRLIKKYNIDIFLFSAWSKQEIEDCTSLSIKIDTRKSVDTVNTYTRGYSEIIFIEDEPKSYIEQGLFYTKLIQPNYEFGMVLKDFVRLENYLKEITKWNK